MAEPMPRPTNEDRIKAADWFADRDFGVFSIWSARDNGVCRCPKGTACDSPGKHPIAPDGFKSATRDHDRIRAMLSAASQPNYGLVCPDGIFVLDVDGEDGLARLAELEEQLGPLPPTLRTKTAHGWHIFLRWPDGLPRPIGQLWGYVTRWGSGQGAGYVIGPRSVHPSGVEYTPGDVFEIAELPEAWARSVIDRKAAGEPFIRVDAGGYQLPEDGYTGSRYDAILEYVASRYMRGMTVDEIYAGVVSVLAPRFAEPLDEPELRSRFERAWRRTPERLGEPDAGRPADEPLELPDEPIVVPPLDWPEPLGRAAYHGVLGQIVDAVAPTTEADPAAVLGTLLATTGACMGRWRGLYQGAMQGTNLFIILVGDSGTGRKGTASSLVSEVMGLAYPGWRDLIVAGLGSGEGLIERLKPTEDRNEHRALVMASEFSQLLTVMARDGSTLSPVIRDAWDGTPIGRFTVRQQGLVQWHHVGMVAHITATELRHKLTSVDAANGFGNRFLWLAVRRTKLVPFPQSPRDLVSPMTGYLGAAIEEAQTVGELRWSDAAADRWEDLYATSATRRRLGLIGALTARAEAQTARLALLYALLDRATVVELVHLEAAEAVWDYAARSAAYVFGESTGDRHADALLRLVEDGPVEWMTARKELGVHTSADLADAVETLVSAGLVEVAKIPRKGGGRPLRIIQSRG